MASPSIWALECQKTCWPAKEKNPLKSPCVVKGIGIQGSWLPCPDDLKPVSFNSTEDSLLGTWTGCLR